MAPLDFETPEAALASLEDAYRREDLDAAVAAKDFVYEARAMLLALENMEGSVDEDVVKQTAEVLELSFRTFTEQNGFPNFKDVRCTVISKKDLREDLVELVEECVSQDGSKSQEILHAAKNGRGWHIVVMPPRRSR